MTTPWLVAATSVLVAFTTACSSTSVPPSPPPLPALAVSLSQPRWDEGTRNLHVAVINDSSAPITVTSATIQSAGFAREVVEVDEGAVEPGDFAGFLLPYGDPLCETGEVVLPVSMEVVVDGGTRLLALHQDDADLLLRLHEQECKQQRLDAVVTVTLDMQPQPIVRHGEAYLPGNLVLRRPPAAKESAPVTVVSFRGSVLLSLAPDPRRPRGILPVTLEPSVPQVRVPVLVGSEHRCDAHALTNSSQTFLLSSFVRLAANPAQRVIVTPDASTRKRLARIIDRDCSA